jgi:hypothetical protein
MTAEHLGPAPTIDPPVGRAGLDPDAKERER